MRLPILLAALMLMFAGSPAGATTFQIDLSPASGALNLGSTTYTQDHAVGLAPTNEGSQPVSGASGDEVGAGISYDDVTNTLSFDFGYGSAFGFGDLDSDFLAVHFHAPGAVNFPSPNTGGGVIHNLAGFHTASGTRSGRITGSVVLTAGQETQLFDNLIYVNIHSATLTGGELRGQLVVVPEPGSAALAAVGLVLLGCGSRARRRSTR